MTNQSEHRLNQKCFSLFTETHTLMRRKKLTWPKTTQHWVNNILTMTKFFYQTHIHLPNHIKIQLVFSRKPLPNIILWRCWTDMAEWVNPGDEREYFDNDKKGHSVSMSRQSKAERGGGVRIFFKCECSYGVVRFDVMLHAPTAGQGMFRGYITLDFRATQLLPPSISLSVSHSMCAQCWVLQSREGTDGRQGSAHRHHRCARQGGARSKGKSDKREWEPMGAWCWEWIKCNKYRWMNWCIHRRAASLSNRASNLMFW